MEVLEFPGLVEGPWGWYIDSLPVARPVDGPVNRRDHAADAGVDAGAKQGQIGTVQYPRVVARDEACAKELKKRTLTNLYNARPAWLDLAHRKLDEAVFAAYGWPATVSDDELLGKLLELNLGRAGK